MESETRNLKQFLGGPGGKTALCYVTKATLLIYKLTAIIAAILLLYKQKVRNK